MKERQEKVKKSQWTCRDRREVLSLLGIRILTDSCTCLRWFFFFHVLKCPCFSFFLSLCNSMFKALLFSSLRVHIHSWKYITCSCTLSLHFNIWFSLSKVLLGSFCGTQGGRINTAVFLNVNTGSNLQTVLNWENVPVFCCSSLLVFIGFYCPLVCAVYIDLTNFWLSNW